MADNKRIFWDSCVFITLLSKHTEKEYIEKQSICTSCLQNAIDGKVEIFISTITIVEVNKTSDSTIPIPDDVKDKIRNLLDQPFVKIVSSDLARALEARNLIWQYSWLQPADALHLACALHAKVSELFAYDGGGEKKGLLDLNGLVGIPTLKICPPHFEGIQTTLDT